MKNHLNFIIFYSLSTI